MTIDSIGVYTVVDCSSVVCAEMVINNQPASTFQIECWRLEYGIIIYRYLFSTMRSRESTRTNLKRWRSVRATEYIEHRTNEYATLQLSHKVQIVRGFFLWLIFFRGYSTVVDRSITPAPNEKGVRDHGAIDKRNYRRDRSITRNHLRHIIGQENFLRVGSHRRQTNFYDGNRVGSRPTSRWSGFKKSKRSLKSKRNEQLNDGDLSACLREVGARSKQPHFACFARLGRTCSTNWQNGLWIFWIIS